MDNPDKKVGSAKPGWAYCSTRSNSSRCSCKPGEHENNLLKLLDGNHEEYLKTIASKDRSHALEVEGLKAKIANLECADPKCNPLRAKIEEIQAEISRMRELLDTAHKVFAADCDGLGKTIASQTQRIEELKEALESIVNQFAYEGKPVNGVSSITSGGLSALEEAFEALGYDDPQPMPHKQCNWAGCTEHACCGVPTKKGYKFVCGEHSDLIHKGDLSGLATEAKSALEEG